MRYVRIFLLYFENVFQYRSQIFVWFLISLLHPLIYLLFWKGSLQEFPHVIYYYLFFIVAGGLLFVHVEVDAYDDIQQGQLSLYLVKPFSYLLIKFLDELPWRIIQGFFGLIALSIISFFVILPQFSLRLDQILSAIMITVFGYLIMFLFKMIILLSALWVTDIGGIQQLSEMIVIIFAGFIMPIRFFPSWVQGVVNLTPFPYTMYFPVIAFQGLVQQNEIVIIVIAQLIWITLLYILYVSVWHIGLKKYNAIGQ